MCRLSSNSRSFILIGPLDRIVRYPALNSLFRTSLKNRDNVTDRVYQLLVLVIKTSFVSILFARQDDTASRTLRQLIVETSFCPLTLIYCKFALYRLVYLCIVLIPPCATRLLLTYPILLWPKNPFLFCDP